VFLTWLFVALQLPEAALGPIILPLMKSLKLEQDEVLQHRSAVALASLMQLARLRTPSPNDKLVTNLSSFVTLG
jgi:TATA-binding protein-associated factor